MRNTPNPEFTRPLPPEHQLVNEETGEVMPPADLTVVGDSDQSIYAFRGATSETSPSLSETSREPRRYFWSRTIAPLKHPLGRKCRHIPEPYRPPKNLGPTVERATK